VQAVVVPVAEAFNEYAEAVRKRLFDAGFRVEADLSTETMKYKIRNAQTQQIPYMLVVGEREQEAGAVAVRKRRGGDAGTAALDAFVQQMRREVDNKLLEEEVLAEAG
jgi:threonyl-tRNA synthetase